MTEQKTTPTPPPIQDLPAEPEPAFGWTEYAERMNGRVAMIAFLGLLLLESVTHQDLFTWLGLR
ncbi:chlorophyll a-b binding domain-containing protein [Laspinema olomoucense]|uniref:chlorophyll a-b binding domain-containing protein n=1 Tax=Laspinema olomoucense TaxID=3231600 RepID=UPI0021BA6CB0|nr:chlorophyll a-b binding domain-containing protein [Laspinema sp. D3c]MCT7993731.1 chlorophyll a-b binding domain-containing protein [Laspinema sp. D3c]